MPVEEELLTKEDTVRLKRCLYALQRNGLPPVTTHNVINDWSDPVLNTIRRCNLFNTTADKVKVKLDCWVGSIYFFFKYSWYCDITFFARFSFSLKPKNNYFFQFYIAVYSSCF